MAKPTGAACNLACEYCFFLDKGELYPAGTRMSDQTLRTYLEQLLQGHETAAEVVVALQGGEPTLAGLDFYQRVIELERELARPGQRVVNTIQTNGTLLDDAWGAFLAEHDVLVGLSIDGPAPLHDAYRVDRRGRPSFAQVMRGLDVLRGHRVRWNALTSVHAANGDHGRAVYTFLRDTCGARHIQFIPIVERVGNRVADFSIDAQRFGQFMVDVFEEWVRRDVGTVSVQMFETAAAHWMGLANGGICSHAETCGAQVALGPLGDVYACDHFFEPRWRLGDITTGDTLAELVRSPRQIRFGEAKGDLPQVCLDCPVRFACHGGCPKDRFVVGPGEEPGLNHLCAGYRRLFTHLDQPMRAMVDLLRQGRPASDIMATVHGEDAGRSPNSRCPCGGGAKWKRCHGCVVLPEPGYLG